MLFKLKINYNQYQIVSEVFWKSHAERLLQNKLIIFFGEGSMLLVHPSLSPFIFQLYIDPLHHNLFLCKIFEIFQPMSGLLCDLEPPLIKLDVYCITVLLHWSRILKIQ